ncbi:MAG: L-histidine N(alpha)-methyltransferase [Actinobacteria bacterium]|nr:L-histidine N(alpha)-methyltransferase [Actinomycetota bacterium]
MEPVGELSFAPVIPSLRLDVFRGDEWITAFANDVNYGLGSEPRELPPKYFYDARGSRLFDRITELPEYYPTRTERAILERCAGQIVGIAGAETLVELGSGSSHKTELLLEPLIERAANPLYVPIDFSESAVREASVRLIEKYTGLRVHGVIGDFEKHLGGLPPAPARLFAFLGGTIGNMKSDHMAFFLKRLGRLLGPADSLLVGVDLVKESGELEAAYNDAQGVTAEFNKNVLATINDNLSGDFDLDGFDHIAFFDPENSWIEMRLRANAAQSVRIGALDMRLEFEAGDEIRTEISRKFSREEIERELRIAGLEPYGWYTDEDSRFALTLAAPAAGQIALS